MAELKEWDKMRRGVLVCTAYPEPLGDRNFATLGGVTHSLRPKRGQAAHDISYAQAVSTQPLPSAANAVQGSSLGTFQVLIQ